MRNPAVSILLPVHDAGETLGACLRSIRRQTFVDWECVVADDGSTDDGPGLVRAAADVDRRFRLVSLPRSGLVPALQAGLSACRGRYVARLDGDDLMHRRRLEAQVALLEERPDLAGAGCHVRLFPRARLGPGRLAYEAWLNRQHDERAIRRDLFVECPVAHPSLMLRRSALARVPYRDAGWPEDYDLVLRLVLGGHPIGMVPRRLLLWRDHDRRLSRTSAVYSIERFTACKAAHLARSFLARHRDYHLWGYGATGRNLRRELARHGRHATHVIDVHPRRVGNRIHGAPVVAPDALAALPRLPLVVSVAGEPARRLIRRYLATRAYRDPTDFVCAA